MTENIQKKSEELTQKLKDQTLSAKQTNLREKISRFKKYANNVILCDVSGSMGDLVSYEGNTRKIDVLKHVMANFEGAQVYEFSTHCNKAAYDKISEPISNTNLGRALATMKVESHKHIILVTDGQPDSEDEALRNAQGLQLDIIYIGPQPVPEFLKKLASLTNGHFVDIDMLKLEASQSEKVLENRIRGFLNA